MEVENNFMRLQEVEVINPPLSRTMEYLPEMAAWMKLCIFIIRYLCTYNTSVTVLDISPIILSRLSAHQVLANDLH